MRIRPPIPTAPLRVALLAALLTGSALLAGCGAADQPTPSTAVETTPTSTSSDETMSFSPPQPAEINAVTAFAALDTYWSTAYPVVFDERFVPLRGGQVPLDSGDPTGSALCISSPGQISGNAYYCPDEDGIVYDTGVLVPVLVDHYGPVGLLTSLAHEYGHAIAARLGAATGSAMARELQADCLAGAFLAWTVTSDAPFGLTPGAALPAVAPLLDFGDQADADPAAATAHGMALDRAQAVRLGYAGGPVTCRDLTASSISVVLGRVAAPASTAPRYASDAAVEQAALDSARATVAPDLPTATPPAEDVGTSRVYGEFALATATVLASAAASGLDDREAGCLTGRWTAAVFGTVGPDQLGGRPTDADQALNLVRGRESATTDSLFGFVDGFAGHC